MLISATLNIDPTRIAIGGQSAGGGLAASLASRIHGQSGRSDQGRQDGVQPKAQRLLCPMLDDRTAANRQLDDVEAPAEAVPARRTNFECLSPA